MDIFSVVTKECGIESVLMSGKHLSTFGSGGVVRLFMPKSIDKLCRILECCGQYNYEYFLLGGGSNTIIADEINEDKIVISTKGVNRVKLDNGYIYAECGASLLDVIKCGRKNGVGGLEFMYGVPCTIGGMTRMNASAFMHKTSDYVSKIDILSVDCDKNRHYSIKSLYKCDVEFGYRQGVRDIVLAAYFQLPKMSKEESIFKALEYAKLRNEKQPKCKSVGSVFLNGDVPSGMLIEKCGLKGVGYGGARISTKHANVIINFDNAKSSDFLFLAKLCQEKVYEKFGIKLKREFVMLN